MYKKIKKFQSGGGTGQSLPNPNSSFSPNRASIIAQQNLQFNTPDIGSMASNQFSNFSSNITSYSNVPQTITSESGFTRPDMANMNFQQMQAATTPSFDQKLGSNIQNYATSYAINKLGNSIGLENSINGLTSGLTNSNGVATRMIGGAANSALKNVAAGAIAGAAKAAGKSLTTTTIGSGLKAGAKGALSSMGSASGIAGLANAGIQVAFGNQRKAGWENAVNMVGGIASMIPGVGWGLSAGLAAFNLIGGLTGKKTIAATGKDWQSRQAQSSVAGGYSGAMEDIADAESREGSYSGFNSGARRRANRLIAKTNAWKDTMWDWAQRNDLNDIRSNQMNSINNNQYQTNISGGYDLSNSGRMLVAKEGAKLFDSYKSIKEYTKRIKSAKQGSKLVKEEPKIEEPIIDKELERYYDDPLFSTKSKYNDDFHQGGSWSEDGKTFTPSKFSLFNFTQEQIAEALSKEFPEASLNITDEVRAFKEGGKVNSRDMNVIPEGALHARLNHMDNKDFTKKGIPVVAKDGDKLEQTAEIERNEIIFNLSVTNKLEELMKDGSAKAALEAGKLLVEEILHNTIDNTGLIKEVE